METEFLNPRQLAKRWNLAYKTISNWRCSGYGPEYHQMGNRIKYRLEDVEQFEMSKRRRSTSDNTNCPPKNLLKQLSSTKKKGN